MMEVWIREIGIEEESVAKRVLVVAVNMTLVVSVVVIAVGWVKVGIVGQKRRNLQWRGRYW